MNNADRDSRHRKIDATNHRRSRASLSDTFLNTQRAGVTSHYRSVYEAILSKLRAEAERRGKRAVEAWILAERQCVMREVNRQRGLLAYDPVEIAAVERAERLAVGHADYISKYACAAADLVFRKETT